jgi:hypothetical protein
LALLILLRIAFIQIGYAWPVRQESQCFEQGHRSFDRRIFWNCRVAWRAGIILIIVIIVIILLYCYYCTFCVIVAVIVLIAIMLLLDIIAIIVLIAFC